MCSHQLSLGIEQRFWSRIGKGRYLTQKNSNAGLRHYNSGHKGSDIKVLKMPKKKKKKLWNTHINVKSTQSGSTIQQAGYNGLLDQLLLS